MVSSSMSRRRHTLAPPAICRKGPPVPPFYPPAFPCTCGIAGHWWADTKKLDLGFSAYLTDLPDGDPLTFWASSTPVLTWANPYAATNNHTTFVYHIDVPPGTLFVAITVIFDFSNGRHCSAHVVIDTPGA